MLVCGLLAAGVAAGEDGLFARLGHALERLPGSSLTLLAASFALVAAVTAVLNLDTAVVFLTPILIHAARARGASEEPFLYGTVLVANASSLYLPGSNLTNLLVLAHDPLSGSAFAARTLFAALTASSVTALALLALLRFGASDGAGARRAATDERIPVAGAVVVVMAAVAVVALRQAALVVLAIGLAAVGLQVLRRRLDARAAVRAIGPVALLALFALAVALGTLARAWDGPSELLAQADRLETAGIGAISSVLVNNLPAAVLLSAHPPAHPVALLLGLNVGPNLAPSGSLSVLLWWRAARQVGARPSLRRYTALGVAVAPLAIGAALLASA